MHIGETFCFISFVGVVGFDFILLFSNFFFQNAHDNIICAIVYNGQYLFTSSHSCIKVALLNLFKSFDFINFSRLLLPVMVVI